LLGHMVDVIDIEVDQGVRSSVTLVLRQVHADAPTSHGDEPRTTGLELMLPLLYKPEPPIPADSPRRVLNIANRHNLLIHRPTLTLPMFSSRATATDKCAHERRGSGRTVAAFERTR